MLASPEITAALAANPVAASLLTDHILGATDYAALIDPADPMNGKRTGQAILFGSTTIGGKTVRYTIGAQFVIEDSKLTYWNLDRAILNKTVGAVLRQPLTAHVLAAKPSAVINIWYAANDMPPRDLTYVASYSHRYYRAQIVACGAVPGGEFPGLGQPFVAFSYDDWPYFNEAPFVMIAGKTVVAKLLVYPADNDPVQLALLPDGLGTGASRDFEELYVEATPNDEGGPMLQLWTPPDPSEAEKQVYTSSTRRAVAGRTDRRWLYQAPGDSGAQRCWQVGAS